MINDTDGRKARFIRDVERSYLLMPQGDWADVVHREMFVCLNEAEIAAINERHAKELVAARGEGADLQEFTELMETRLRETREDLKTFQSGDASVLPMLMDPEHGLTYLASLRDTYNYVLEMVPDTTTYTETIRAEERAKVLEEATKERIYPCDDCGVMRTKAEGGTTFTVCEECWDKHYKSLAQDKE